MAAAPITVYYDGQCPLCSREIEHYRALVRGASVLFVDLTQPGFDPVRERVDPDQADKILHVKVGEKVRTGLDAVITLWEAIPAYGWLGRIARLPILYSFFNAGYRVFAHFRPYLQRILGRRRRSSPGAMRCSKFFCSHFDFANGIPSEVKSPSEGVRCASPPRRSPGCTPGLHSSWRDGRRTSPTAFPGGEYSCIFTPDRR